MPTRRPTIHLLCGKIAAGKSTLAAKLASETGAVLIVEDDWLAGLYLDEMKTPKDYVRCTQKLRQMMGPHVVTLLNNEVSIVLDFQANTLDSRRWMRTILDQVQADHQLHVLSPPDDVCLARLKERNLSGDHAFSISEEQFHHFAKYFELPTPEEGFNLIFHD